MESARLVSNKNSIHLQGHVHKGPTQAYATC